jgi:hypothetical protein
MQQAVARSFIFIDSPPIKFGAFVGALQQYQTKKNERQ